jgi:hypothetical protein
VQHQLIMTAMVVVGDGVGGWEQGAHKALMDTLPMVGPIDDHWNAYNGGKLKETKTRSPLVSYHSTPPDPLSGTHTHNLHPVI